MPRRLWAAHARRSHRSAAGGSRGVLALPVPLYDSHLVAAAPSEEHRRWLLAAAAAGASDRTLAAFAHHTAPLAGRRLARALDPLAQPPGLLRQQSSTTCGSAALVVARMLVDPVYSLAVLDGYQAATGERGPGDVASRFAAQEEVVKRRTNGVRGPRGLGVPWPRSLGTPPWGACREMNGPAGRPGTRYRVVTVDSDSVPSRTRAYDLVAGAASAGLAVPLYVGDAALPRHVALVVATGPDRGSLRVYDPGRGDVGEVDRSTFRAGRLAVAGWHRPWAVVVPG